MICLGEKRKIGEWSPRGGEDGARYATEGTGGPAELQIKLSVKIPGWSHLLILRRVAPPSQRFPCPVAMSHVEVDHKHSVNDGALPEPRTGDEPPPAYYVSTLSGTARVAAVRRVWGFRSKLALIVGTHNNLCERSQSLNLA
jgi:hypothetical protein